MTKTGLGSYIPLRGRSGQTIKAWRGKEGYKEAQALESKIYPKYLLKQAKPKIEKALNKPDNKSGYGSVSSTTFKGARGAPLKVKQKLVKVNTLKQVNQKNLQDPVVTHRSMTGRVEKTYPQRLENKMKDTGKKLDKIEKNVKANYRKTDTYKNLEFKSTGGLIKGLPKLAKKGWK